MLGRVGLNKFSNLRSTTRLSKYTRGLSIFKDHKLPKSLGIEGCESNQSTKINFTGLVKVQSKREYSSNVYVSHPPILTGSCSCGSVGWEGQGQSAINFTCHCSICRSASGKPFLTAAGFKPEQVKFLNEEGLDKRYPENSKNLRFYCKKCNDYVAEDATRVLGVIGLPLHLSKSVDDAYKPNHHIFYKFRSQDVQDSLPKWETLPEGVSMRNPGEKPQANDAEFHNNVKYSQSTGRFRKDVLPISPLRPPYPSIYNFTENDPVPNHETYIDPAKVEERISKKYHPSPGEYIKPTKSKRDVIIIGGGHNGLVTAAYLAKHGLDVLVLERRHLVGGAAVTEELYPGFKFSRASYLAGLFRPQIIKDLNLENYGFKYLTRNPSSFTPTKLDGPYQGKHLIIGENEQENWKSIAQFSKKDADNFPKYEEFLGKVRDIMQPLLDGPPPDPFSGNWNERKRSLKQIAELAKIGWKNRDILVPFYELFTGPAQHILDRWFESEVLKTTLATDAVIGAMVSPTWNGSAYVLLHHVMGEAAGKKGVWSYVQGGMGALSQSIARSAQSFGAEIVTNATVKNILYEKDPKTGKNKSVGVKMSDGSHLYANTIVSNANPYHTFLELIPGLSRDSGNESEDSPLPRDFQHHIRFQDYNCGAMKINCAVDSLPNFLSYPSPADGKPGPQHRGTIHFENIMEEIDNAAREASMGIPATRPVIEMTIPSSLDSTLAPPGKHVVQLFVQFVPYAIDPKIGSWADPAFKEAIADRVFKIVEEFAPNFSKSVLYRDILSPLDLERVFGLQKGNIMHGALSLHQLAYARPVHGFSRHRTPLDSLYLCGAGAHPGGGVMGAAGKNCAFQILSDLNIA
eukprot:TRINITY_DN8132_c0_g1_i1.p1 TRINITY_DN8132_c0_g1~~TRINITY_DN8132_c0_g1_i1.p1  ORF type:complete len:857 (+),score=192.80 TRINITY_DN8132_c0_g1_i1:21-2591(+)